jgi:hypothetical protein
MVHNSSELAKSAARLRMVSGKEAADLHVDRVGDVATINVDVAAETRWLLARLMVLGHLSDAN